MSYSIVCPYCFHKINDDEVLFRSEKVNQGESDILPDDFDDVEDFKARYTGDDKEDILSRYQDWEFFAETDDPEYTAFWANFNGTTEYNPADDVLRVKAYRRRILDPSLAEHRRFIRTQSDGTPYIRDSQGMVTQIELISGEKCNRRVCCHCHNPLPDNYGKNNVKFASVIGITGAGKTVYLSQLLRRMRSYSVKVGLNAIVNNTGVRTFLEKNSIAANTPLPGSTPAQQFQQPLFYEMVRDAQDHGRITETFVLYDVAGEVFKDPALIIKFAPFIEHSDGIIVLIDPMQFEIISGASSDGKALVEPTTVLEAIHNIVSQSGSDMQQKCEVPVAVCLSQTDKPIVQSVFSAQLREALLNDVHGIVGSDGLNKQCFNAVEYAPIARELRQFIFINDPPLGQLLQVNYKHYAFFAFTALGCKVETGQRDNGEPYQYPVGPVLPKRVEEPLLWLFYRLHYIGTNGFLPGEIRCPVCGTEDTYELPEDESYIMVKKGLFKKEKQFVNRCCKVCGHKWEYIPEN